MSRQYVASYFIGRHAETEEAESVSAKPLKEVRSEITALHEESRALRENIPLHE
jgi:hypothetical protein